MLLYIIIWLLYHFKPNNISLDSYKSKCNLTLQRVSLLPYQIKRKIPRCLHWGWLCLKRRTKERTLCKWCSPPSCVIMCSYVIIKGQSNGWCSVSYWRFHHAKGMEQTTVATDHDNIFSEEK